MRTRSGTIKESLTKLQRFERRYRNQPQELRIKALRLIKEHANWTNEQVGNLLGRSKVTVQRWWNSYQRRGLKGLLDIGKAGGKRPSRLDPIPLGQLQKRLQEEGFLDLKEAQRYLADELGVHYSYSGVRYLIRIKLKSKLKTGRPKAKGQDAVAVAEFKKTVWKS